MHISLSEIMNLNGESRTFSAPIEMETYSYMGRSYDFGRKEPVAIELISQGHMTVQVRMSIVLELVIPCDRCLEPVTEPFEISRDFRIKLNEDGCAVAEDDDEPLSYINGYSLDTEQLVWEEVMIGFPMKVLCSDDCRGLCKICGANLNKGECGCDRTELDPRMSKIRDIFNQKEV